MDDLDNDIVSRNTQEQPNPSPALNPTILIWVIAAIALSLLMITKNTSELVANAGIVQKVFAVLAGIALGSAGALIGNALRKLASPDGVFTTGGFFQLIWIKVFWSIGPQCIGLVIGVALGEGMILQL